MRNSSRHYQAIFAKKVCIFLLIVINNLIGVSQTKDSTVILKLEDIYRGMLEYHPIVKQARLLNEVAKQELNMARGSGFDPKISSTWDNKMYNGKEYFNIWQNSLKIPTWFGVDFKVGYDEMYGDFLNPQNYIPTNGLSYVGLTLPIGQGLIMDQRRATLRQAQAFQQINDAEKVKIINKIFFDAAKDYWEWYFRFKRYKNLEIGINLASDRYIFVKKKVNIGEEAAIDSTEALILLQSRDVTYSQSFMEYRNAALQLSNYLWDQNNTPLEVDTNVQPEYFNLIINKITPETTKDLIENAKINHPELRKLQFKLVQLDVERRLAIENIKPVINLNYNLLSLGKFQNFELKNFNWNNNSKYGFDISFPLLFRKEIGKLKLTKAKINQNNFETNYMTRQIQNEISKYYNELLNTENLILTQNLLVKNSTILRNGELEKFNNGESSLFLVNSRETNLIETQIKLAEFESKYEKAKAALYWSAGRTEF